MLNSHFASGKRLCAGISAAALILSLVPAAFAAQTDPLTRGEARDRLISAAKPYHSASPSDVLKGDENGNLQENRSLTRAEALIMLQRAFGGLPRPVGANARNAFPVETFTDIPDWAVTELEDALEAGIIAGTGEGKFSPDELVTKEELETWIHRVFALEGSNEKDDFYAAVNREWLANSTIPAGRTSSGTLYDVTWKVNQQVAGLISDLADQKQNAGTPEAKISALYRTILDSENREKEGIEPIRSYLDEIDQIDELDDWMDVYHRLQAELSLGVLIKYGLTTDLKDSTRYSLTFATFSPSLEKEFYTSGSQQQFDAYHTYLTTMFQLGGESETQAEEHAKLVYETEKTLSAVSLRREEQGDVDKIYNVFSQKELKELFPNVDMDQIYQDNGLKPSSDPIIVSDVELTKAVAALFDNKNIETLKTFTKLYLLSGVGGCLNEEFQEASNQFSADYLGVEGSQTDEEIAALYVQNFLADYLGQAYSKKYFSKEAKENVETMIQEILNVYRDRLQTLDWMSSETKKMALKKLDTMKIKVGYPDDNETYLDQAEIKAPEDGGTFFTNIISLSKAAREYQLTRQGEKVDKTEWSCPAYTVNAFYDPTCNDITFPAGILQAPIYDVDAKPEQNMGGIGYIIAHEITHAFDNSGAKFDENGNAANWWTESDYSTFQNLCQNVIDWYDGQEAIPGLSCNGKQTLSENVADLGAAACITEVVSQMENPDYETLFRSIAQSWASTSGRPYQQSMLSLDVHAPDKLRVNRVLQTIDQFYETFDIQEGDGMWVAPADRVRIW